MPYYPAQTLILGMTVVRRDRILPPQAFSSEVQVKESDFVEAADVVAIGAIPADFTILDALRPLGLRRASDLTPEMVKVQQGDGLKEGDVILENGKKVLKAPAKCLLTRVENGQVILRTNPTLAEARAQCPGQVTSIRGSIGVQIESVGALIQCVWGNGKTIFSTLKEEPEEGIESLEGDILMSAYRNNAMFLRRPIASAQVFTVAAQQTISAIIAPGMHADMREVALRQSFPVILTEGFGDLQMSEMVYNLLRGNVDRPACIDAIEPSRWSSERPEIIIPLGIRTRPPVPELDQALVEGALVRLTRAPWPGMSGRVKKVVDIPRAVENGLRLPGAEIQLQNGRMVFVPLANLEMVGRPLDAQGGA